MRMYGKETQEYKISKIYKDEDANLKWLQGSTIAVIGQGSQGRHQALCMRDSGLNVIVAEIPNTLAWKRAEKDGFKVYAADEASKRGDVVLMLVQDELQGTVYEKEIKPYMTEGKTLGFSSGFSVFYEQVKPPKNIDVIMMCPRAIGPSLWIRYRQGFGVPAGIGVWQDYSGHAWDKTLAWAKAVGATRCAVIKETFQQEVEVDFFLEASGGAPSPLLFEILVEAGYPPEGAWLDTQYETAEIRWLQIEGRIPIHGIESTTAEYLMLTQGKDVLGGVKERLKKILNLIQNGEIAKRWIKENKLGKPELNKIEQENRKKGASLLEVVERQMIKAVHPKAKIEFRPTGERK